MKFKSAQSDYQHKEQEGGATGTVFKNKGNESRLELIHHKNQVEGVIGLQTEIYNFQAAGDEAFLPESKTKKVAAFLFEDYKMTSHTLSFGGRLESIQIQKESSTTFEGSDEKGFTALNGSLGHQYKMASDFSINSSFSYTERAPNFQELFAEGAHIATASYERGDSSLIKEKAYALELGAKKINKDNSISANIYTQRFQDFIFLNPTGGVEEGFSEYEYQQVDALFYGFDLDVKNKITQTSAGLLNQFVKYDFVRAKNTDDGHNLPRISPPRVSLGYELQNDRWCSDVEYQHVFHQNDTSPNEIRTNSYGLTNWGMNYHLIGSNSSMNVFLRVRNIFNVEARNHVSFLKDRAPLPGRNITLGAHFQI